MLRLVRFGVEIWNSRDAEALRDFYAPGIVSAADMFDWSEAGFEENMESATSRMAATEGLRVTPLYSYETESTAYQVGRWAIRGPEGWGTGAHVFMFIRTEDGWKLRSEYYVHDPEPRLDEFPDLLR